MRCRPDARAHVQRLLDAGPEDATPPPRRPRRPPPPILQRGRDALAAFDFEEAERCSRPPWRPIRRACPPPRPC
ncbi:MAG: hypothetical protein R3F43_07090 [bacterium]